MQQSRGKFMDQHFPCKKTEVMHIALLNKELKEENKHSKKGWYCNKKMKNDLKDLKKKIKAF